MRKCVLLVCLLISLSALFAQEEPQFYALRENPPLVPIDMRRPGYWISRHPAPDSLLMTAQEIELLNRRNFRQGHVGQIFGERSHHPIQLSEKTDQFMLQYGKRQW